MNESSLLERTAQVLPHLAGGDAVPVEKGGSARRFYRISSRGQSSILVHDLGEREENRHYAELARFLSVRDVPVPGVLAEDPGAGLLWLEDLGSEDLWSFRNATWEVRRPLYESTLRGIASLHRIPTEAPVHEGIPLQPSFDAALYRWEQEYFAEHCLGGIFGVSEELRAVLLSSESMRLLAAGLATRPRVLVHRDFQSQNILVRSGEARFIDFQGMRPGLPQYDLASLLLDPYVTLSGKEREHLIGFYNAMMPDTDAAESERLLWQCAAQRLMQALGAYGNLSLNLGKPHFRAHVTPALANLREVLTLLHPEDRLDKLEEILNGLNDSQG